MSLLLKNYRERLSRWFIRELKKDFTLLDIGCGEGEVWMAFFAERVKLAIGVDITLHPAWKKLRRMNNDIQFIQADASYLPFRDRAFNVVFEKDALHHISDPVKALHEMRRVSRDYIIIIEANRYHPISYLYMVKIRGHDHFTLAQLDRLVKAVYSNYSIAILQKEAHFAPLPPDSRVLVRIFDMLQDLFEKLLKYLTSYNIILIKNLQNRS